MIIENITYLFPLLVPIYYKLPLEYYIGFCFLCISNYSLKNNKNYLYEIIEYNSYIYLFSLYSFRSVYISYLVTCFSFFDYRLTNGIILRTTIFLFCFFMNFKNNPLLFYPFIYQILLLNRIFYLERRSLFSSMDIIQWNLIQTLFFYLCSSP